MLRSFERLLDLQILKRLSATQECVAVFAFFLERANVLGTPTLVTSGGATTQVSGDHTLSNGNALFTASNTSVGVNDVDGGTCSLASPGWSVLEDSDLSLWYFHGQRDSGGDPAGDFFRFDYSLDGGSSWLPLATHGDISLDADWTEVNASISAGSTLALRVLASDGTGQVIWWKPESAT